MKIKDILINPSFNLQPDSNLSLIIRTFKETGLEVLPVVDKERRLMGVINFEDITKVFEPYSGPLTTLVKTLPFLDDMVEKDFSPDHINPDIAKLCIAEDIMDTNFITLMGDMDLGKAYSLMRIYKVDVACVVKENNLIGMVKLLDIIINLFAEKGVI